MKNAVIVICMASAAVVTFINRKKIEKVIEKIEDHIGMGTDEDWNPSSAE